MRFDKHILSIGLLIGALAYTIWFVFAGFGNHQDPLYWLYKYEHLEGGWLAVGTLLTGGVIVKLFGAQLLPLRLFGWLCTTAAVALPYCCLLTKEQRRDSLHWLALTYILTGYGVFQEFSPGTLSVLLLSALWVTAVQTTNLKLQTASAVLLGLAVAARFPNILALLVLIPLWKKRCLWNISIAAATAGLVYLAGCWLVTPAAADAAMMSGHQFMTMLDKLWTNGGKLVGYMLMAVAVLACSRLTATKPYLSGTLIGLLLAYVIIFTTKPLQWYNGDMTYLVSALAVIVALGTRQKTLGVGVAVLAMATMGTDTAWLKLFPAVLCLVPVAGTYYAREGRVYLWTVLAVLSVFVAIRMTTNSVGQSNLTKATTVASVAPYRGIAITPTMQSRMMQYNADFDSLSNSQMRYILALGQEMHLMRAVTGCDAARYNEFWSNIFDSVYTARYRDIIRDEHPIVFCSFTPQFKTQPTCKDKESALENMLREEGYRAIDRTKFRYMIYIPDGTEIQ